MNEHWFIRMTKWAWTPIIVGVIVCFGTIAIAADNAVEAIPAGLGIVIFSFLAMVKGFSK